MKDMGGYQGAQTLQRVLSQVARVAESGDDHEAYFLRLPKGMVQLHTILYLVRCTLDLQNIERY